MGEGSTHQRLMFGTGTHAHSLNMSHHQNMEGQALASLTRCLAAARSFTLPAHDALGLGARGSTVRGAMRNSRRILLAAILLPMAMGLAACRPEVATPPIPTPTQAPPPVPTDMPVMPTLPAATPTPTEVPSPTPIPASGPTGFPANVNPLTGLPVDDPAVLDRRPLLIKVSNHPAVVRPQNGLSFADHVWEHVVEGWRYTRYTAVFYGQTPSSVGSVRSGRLPDLELVPMYQGLFDASGFSSNRNDPSGPKRMRELMLAANWFKRNFSPDFGYGEPYNVRFPLEGVAYEHTLFAIPEELWKLAAEKDVNQRPTLEPGFAFSPEAPVGGTPIREVVIDFPVDGPKNTWRYDPASGLWLHWVDEVPHTDFLTSEQLAFENLVLVYTQHYEADFIEYESEITRLYSVGAIMQGEGEAVLLRDGQRFDVTWRRPNVGSMMQFFDASGNVIPFKPGQTWFTLIPTNIFPPEVVFTP